MGFYQPNSFPKTCHCGARYESEVAWQLLPMLAVLPGTDHTGKRFCPDLELRNCRCGSTIAVHILPVEDALAV